MARDDARAAEAAPALAAEISGLVVAKAQPDEGPAALARFLVLGKTAPAPTGTDATSLRLGLDDQPGRRARVLERLAAGGADRRRLGSRPADRRGLRGRLLGGAGGQRSGTARRAPLVTWAGAVAL